MRRSHLQQFLRLILPLMLALMLTACNLTNEGDATPTIAAGGLPPIVTITSPRGGDTLAVNQAITVNATASDSIGITRVQLLANGQTVQSVVSPSVGGDRTLPVSIPYTPTQLGAVTLQVIAYRASVASLPAEVQITVGAAPTVTNAPITQQPPPVIVITSRPVVDPFDPTCRLVTNGALNLRTGPGTEYPRILVLNAGTIAPITGRTPTNSWWQVRVGVTSGWVSNQFITLYGNCSGVIIPPIPPTPTSLVIPTWTLVPTLMPSVPAATATFTATPGLPDLLVTTIVGAQTLTLGAGNTPVTSSYAITLTNTGARITGQFNNTLSVSPGTTESLSAIAGLGPGESILLTKDVTFTAAGSYTLQVRADSDSQVSEISEVNNLGFYTVTVSTAP